MSWYLLVVAWLVVRFVSVCRNLSLASAYSSYYDKPINIRQIGRVSDWQQTTNCHRRLADKHMLGSNHPLVVIAHWTPTSSASLHESPVFFFLCRNSTAANLPCLSWMPVFYNWSACQSESTCTHPSQLRNGRVLDWPSIHAQNYAVC